MTALYVLLGAVTVLGILLGAAMIVGKALSGTTDPRFDQDQDRIPEPATPETLEFFARNATTLLAEFDENDHCIAEGWATWSEPSKWRQRRCRHQTSAAVPVNDHCPQAYSTCERCGVRVQFFSVGTHRYGGYSKAVFDAYATTKAERALAAKIRRQLEENPRGPLLVTQPELDRLRESFGVTAWNPYGSLGTVSGMSLQLEDDVAN